MYAHFHFTYVMKETLISYGMHYLTTHSLLLHQYHPFPSRAYTTSNVLINFSFFHTPYTVADPGGVLRVPEPPLSHTELVRKRAPATVSRTYLSMRQERGEGGVWPRGLYLVSYPATSFAQGEAMRDDEAFCAQAPCKHAHRVYKYTQACTCTSARMVLAGSL